METAKHNLPKQTTPFVGRVADLAEIATRLADPACRLLTLVGPGGIGKTRLALEAAAAQLTDFSDGVYLVSLQELETSNLIVPAIAEAIDFPMHQGGDPQQQLIDHLYERSLLLVMDNFEHLLESAGLVSVILAKTRGIKIMTTSREALNLQEEWLWRVTGLEFPKSGPDGDGLRWEGYSAVQLFVQHAQRIRPDFSLDQEARAVIHICELVEGMPLGIELAAAWVRVLPCAEIAQEIERNRDFLTTRARNATPRHRSMRAVLDSSWELLTDEEQRVYRRLSVFRCGFTREAAVVVARASLMTLSALVDKSLLRREPDGRYEMHGLLKQYAVEHLRDELDESLQTHDLHSAFYTDLLHRQWADLQGSRSVEALANIEDEIDNIRKAWHWAVVYRQEAQIDMALDSLWFFFDTRSRYREGEQAFTMAAEALGADDPNAEESLLLGKVLARLGVLYNSLYESEKARALLEEALAIARLFEDSQEIAFTLARLGEVVHIANDRVTAGKFYRESLAVYREIGDRWGTAFVLYCLGIIVAWTEQPEEGKQLCQESYAIFQALENRWGVGMALNILGYHAIALGEYAEAERCVRESLAACQEIGTQWGIAIALGLLGQTMAHQGRIQEAVQCLKQAIKTAVDVQLDHIALSSLSVLAVILAQTGQKAYAVALLTLSRRHLMTVKRAEKDMTQEYLARLEDEMPPADFAAAIEHSQTLDFHQEVRRLLAMSLPPANGANADITPDQPLVDPLTERELEILGHVAAGMSNREIAGELVLALGTVKWYLNQIYSKLGVRSRTQAIARVRELNLLP